MNNFLLLDLEFSLLLCDILMSFLLNGLLGVRLLLVVFKMSKKDPKKPKFVIFALL